MSPDERRIATVALHAGPWDNHDQIVIAVADVLKLAAQHVEAVLQGFRIRQVLNCISPSAANESAVWARYEKGTDWVD